MASKYYRLGRGGDPQEGGEFQRTRVSGESESNAPGIASIVAVIAGVIFVAKVTRR